MEIPLGLRHALESGQCVLFIGAGIGAHLLDSEGKPAPLASALAAEMASHFSIEIGEWPDLAKVSQVVELTRGRKDLEAFLKKRLSDLEPDDKFQWLCSLRWNAIFTTNYDNGIQRAYELTTNPPQTPIVITNASEFVQPDSRFEVPIYHLHGALFGTSKSHVVITEDDYARFTERRRMLFELLKKEFASSTILYIGYSNRDPNWRGVLMEITTEFYPTPLPRSFRVAPNSDPLDREILKAKNIESLDGYFNDFVEAATLALSTVSTDASRLKQVEASVPPDLLPAFEKSPAAVARLLCSWTYVNQAPFNELANVYDFLRGDRPNWALVGSSHHFERDLEEQIYDDILDYATSRTSNAQAIILLGPAGYGTTTLLMSLAANLIRDRVGGGVFALKPGAHVLEGDIDFAATIFPNRPFFFVDNAAEHGDSLHAAIDRLQNMDRPGLFILGERLNEWRQSYRRLRGKEYQLEPLSDPEINRLLDCLSKNSELRVLEPLSRELQFSVIKEKHGKELLVAMREATEGKSFDAILEDEFHGIRESISRRLYLIVSCFYQHGAYVRDQLLAELMGLSLTQLYEKTANATEGVVVYDCIDESRGAFAARVRHRTIAAVVWERCGDSGDKDQILQVALAALNLNYAADKDAFESFIRSDRLVDSIRTLDGKIQFFEKACQKDPLSPYVRQHYARMLERQKKLELALSQIETALKMQPRLRVLHHTHGVILMRLAFAADSDEVARRRLVQSEGSFKAALRMDPRDDYSYQCLAQLYLGWAKRDVSPEEVAEYVAKAERTVSEGLKIVRVRSSLWIESAKIQEFLGDKPSSIQALERAVKDNPGSIIARFILGRTYRKLGDYQRAVEVLEPIILNHHDEFRAFVEYANALLFVNKPYREVIAVLRISTLYGFSDPRFIATLGGMLFMNEQFTEADEVFQECAKHDFTAQELNTIEFRPPDAERSQNALRITGRVISVKAGYAFVESAPYPEFLCPGSKYNGIVMEPGLAITFEPTFTAKGPIADRPKLASKL